MTAATLTSSLEDYLETIFELVTENQHARVRDIASARNVKPGSVSPALKRLSDMGLVTYVQREYVRLTPDGEREARRVFSRHQLLERFFHEVLQLPQEHAAEQACAMEHSLSNEAMDRIVRFFEFMNNCSNVPSNFLELFRQCPLTFEDAPGCGEDCRCAAIISHEKGESSMSLSDLSPGQTGQITRVNARGAVRQRLLDMGLLPDVTVRIERVAPTGDPVWISMHGSQVALRKNEASAVLVAKS